MTADPAVERFRELLRIPTVSRVDAAATDWPAFELFRATLARLYPRLHAALELELVHGHGLLFRWPGLGLGDPSVLMAHYDVVPADEPGWTHPPFAAELVGEGESARIWGRGTLDDKGALVPIVEAVEALIAEGFQPAADVYLFFGHTEETAGDAAEAAVALLVERGVRPALVVDEGGAVVEGVFPGVSGPIALIGVSERGIATVRLSVVQTGGHAGTPPREIATVRLARAIVRLHRRPFRPRLPEPTVEMIRTLGGHSRGVLRAVFRNVGALRPVVARVFTRLGPELNAMVRTTTVVTRLSGSAGDNVLAERATASVNVRVAVGSTVDAAVAHIRRAIADPKVELTVEQADDPSPVSDSSGPAWETLTAAIAQTFPAAIVSPYVMNQASDSRHFARISRGVYRFLPFDLTTEERGTLHAIDESIRVSTYLRAIEFFRALLQRV